MTLTLQLKDYLIFVAIFTIFGCSTATITIKTKAKASVNQIVFNKVGQESKKFGVTPYTLELNANEGNAFEVSTGEKIPVYILPIHLDGQQNDVFLRMKEAETIQLNHDVKGEPAKLKKSQKNKLMRLLLQGQKALDSSDFKKALTIANEAAKIDPKVAAPLLVSGKALASLGSTHAARKTLNKAKAIDPEDPMIEEALRVLK